MIVAELNRPAPVFESRSTEGIINLSDLQGRWVLLCFHPADFTPVCSSEFAGLERRRAEFEALSCQILCLSPDSVHAHQAWRAKIEEIYGVKPEFPFIEDPAMIVSRAYGMVHEESRSTAAMRCAFFINPAGLIRAALQYPMEVARSVDELLRVLQALQNVDARGCVVPEGWKPGDPLPQSYDALYLKRFKSSVKEVS